MIKSISSLSQGQRKKKHKAYHIYDGIGDEEENTEVVTSGLSFLQHS